MAVCAGLSQLGLVRHEAGKPGGHWRGDFPYVGLNVHKAISVAVADAGRSGEGRHVGSSENEPTAIGKLVRKLKRQHGAVEFVYEAGSCGYNVQRQLAGLGVICRVCAPSLTPRRPRERITNA